MNVTAIVAPVKGNFYLKISIYSGFGHFSPKSLVKITRCLHICHFPVRSHFPLLLTTYLLACLWLGFRSWQALPRRRWLRNLWPAFIAALTFSFMIGMLLRFAGLWEPLARFCWLAGGVWLVTLPYWCLITFAFELVRIAVHLRPSLVPPKLRQNPQRVRALALLGSVLLVILIFTVGYVRFLHPQVTRVAIHIDKPAIFSSPAPSSVPSPALPQPLRVAFAADLHIGDIIGKKRTADYVRRINALNPDLILLAGDLLDNGLAPLVEQDIGAELAKLRAPFGVYAVLGNHETYSGADDCAAYFNRHGIRILRDEAVALAGGALWLAGRNDATLRTRKPLPDLLADAGIDRTRPLILLDHQPRDLAASAAAGVDLQLSGHTHNGQVWPINLIVARLYEVARGYARRGDFQIYVTSGLGLWGLPARIGTTSETVDLEIGFRHLP
ncbi:MAG: metallophosphoesterase [Opitutaceae bacterium]|jgi:predicted MPP superfamily phosphohydrolase|nr:metallophosphoesterase [Opitutaceae bacterium]